MKQIVAVALPCRHEHEDVERSEARGGDGLGLVCWFRQAASSCLRILFCRVCSWNVGKPVRCK
jgi:hypothetical protein